MWRPCFAPDVREDIERAAELAPLHNPPALKVMDALNQTIRQAPQVTCFDTAFHADNPEEATVIPIPLEYRERGIRRYGFHGLSIASLVRTEGMDADALDELLNKKKRP